MANFEKFTRSDLGLFAHCERKKDEYGNYVTFGNERIDPERTHLNYNLCTDTREQKDILEARLSDPNVKCMNRADVIIYGSWCVTLPTHAPVYDDNGNIIYEENEVHHKDGTVEVKQSPKQQEVYYTDEETKDFFRLCYEFLSERYGTENVISSYVHMDETTPHMHFLFIPVVDDKKWNEKHPDKPPRKKVCAKELMDQTEMSMFHRVFQEYLDEHAGKNRYPVLNGTTVGGNRTIAEMKAESAIEEAILTSQQAQLAKESAEELVKEVDQKIQDKQTELEQVQLHLSEEKNKLKNVQDILTMYNSYIKDINTEYKNEQSKLNSVKEEIAKSQAEKLQKQAEKEQVQNEVNQAKSELTQVQTELDNYTDAKAAAEKELQEWEEKIEQKELPKLKEMENDLSDMGVTSDTYNDLSAFTASLDHPVKDSKGNSYVYVPNPDETIPLLKKIMNKVLSMIEHAKDLSKKFTEKKEQVKLSLFDTLKKKQQIVDKNKESETVKHKQKDIHL